MVMFPLAWKSILKRELIRNFCQICDGGIDILDSKSSDYCADYKKISQNTLN